MKKNRAKKNTFETQMMDAGRIPNLVSGLVIIVYIFYFSNIPFHSMGLLKTVQLCAILALIIVFLQFVIAPRTNHLLTIKISDMLREDEEEGLSSAERTKLIKMVMSCPLKISIEVFLAFMLAVITVAFIFALYFKFNGNLLAFVLTGFLFGSAIASVTTYIYAENLCTKTTQKLLQKEVDKERIAAEKFYGLRLSVRVFFHVIFPFIFSCILQIMYLWKGLRTYFMSKEEIVVNLLVMLFFNAGLCIALSYFFYRHIIYSANKSVKPLEKLIQGSNEHINIRTDLGYELEYNLFQVNEIITYWQRIVKDTTQASVNILGATTDLANTAEKNASTSLTESASVRECLSTMETVKQLLLKESEKINNVRSSAETTQNAIQESFKLLRSAIEQMVDITEANLQTITGIKKLSEKIEDVDKIIKQIDAIAEKNKMIAFNAELKAGASNENAENFHIIASELRRLVATISVSTQEIRETIKAIQVTSDNLIISSEGGTQKIREGSDFFSGLEENFKELLTSSNITYESAIAIQNIINEQYESFLQINTSLYQMSIGFDDFSRTTQQIKDAAEKLRQTSQELTAIREDHDGEKR